MTFVVSLHFFTLNIKINLKKKSSTYHFSSHAYHRSLIIVVFNNDSIVVFVFHFFLLSFLSFLLFLSNVLFFVSFGLTLFYKTKIWRSVQVFSSTSIKMIFWCRKNTYWIRYHNMWVRHMSLTQHVRLLHFRMNFMLKI